MLKHLVITVVGPDRPGLVGLLATTVAEHGGSWLASSLSQLSGQFAGVVQLQVDQQQLPQLTQSLQQLPDLQILFAHGEQSSAAGDRVRPESRPALLEITANDRPGIVREISTVLASLQINVQQLETSSQSAPAWGQPLFVARLQLQVPATTSEQVLTEALEALADDLMVDLRFEPHAA